MAFRDHLPSSASQCCRILTPFSCWIRSLSLSPHPGACRLSTPSRMLFGAGARALIAPLSVSIWLESEWARETGHLIAHWVSWGLSIAGRLWPSAWLNQRLCGVSGHIREPSAQCELEESRQRRHFRHSPHRFSSFSLLIDLSPLQSLLSVAS